MNDNHTHRQPPGYAIVELTIAAMLTVIVCTAILGLLSNAARTTRDQIEWILWNEARRTVNAALEDELRYLDPNTDLALATDTLGLRAVRGVATTCATQREGATVRYAGARLPEPAKDSVLVLDPRNGDHALALQTVRKTTSAARQCRASPETTLLIIGVGEAIPEGALILVFETGSYHLADHALRYRRGLGGRQPLTTEAFRSQPGTFESSPSSVGLTLFRARNSTREEEPDPRDPAQMRTARYRISLLNALTQSDDAPRSRPGHLTRAEEGRT